jgi:hypothetical protein
MAGQMSSSPGKRREMDLMKLYSPAQHNHPVSLRPSATTRTSFSSGDHGVRTGECHCECTRVSSGNARARV